MQAPCNQHSALSREQWQGKCLHIQFPCKPPFNTVWVSLNSQMWLLCDFTDRKYLKWSHRSKEWDNGAFLVISVMSGVTFLSIKRSMRKRCIIQGCTWSATMCPELEHYWEGRLHVRILTAINRIRKGRGDSGGHHQEPKGEGPPTHTYPCLSPSTYSSGECTPRAHEEFW